ncbi:BREX-1 system phosphatase PglZ type B [Deinococcus soli (ex Cha et al. 2016)]|uniref:BREX-1 system phosphatase PglZ type B n=1 Tax=Deinococcus soli (ex Cha et al. 2016) TaxID=1309411 RepID=A0A0F7JQJ4_9DEIO|nr:BREX-1 system phosphatase PglZ type B [Deinococcus soli (ex Cha et al. 2016)]AKH16745.1 hypothetical protein SY84_06365 [Deinococcus soli (ex Cha et al. 2016)]
MPATPRLFDVLLTRLKGASAYNKGDQVAPAALLWFDPGRQWESAIPELRPHLPVLTLGRYDLASLTGPALWLRAAIAGTLPDVVMAQHAVPVLYLPGVSRDDLRPGTAAKELRPLVELQYRGATWVHPNGRPWGVSAFLTHPSLGANVAVVEGAETKAELLRALPRLLTMSIEDLRVRAPLSVPVLRAIQHPDLEGEVLAWLNDPQETDSGFGDAMQAVYGLHPREDGPLQAAAALAQGDGAWEQVWRRFRDQPGRYPGVVAQLEAAHTQGAAREEAWPQVNQAHEDALRAELAQVGTLAPAKARARLTELDAAHGARRAWVWAELGRAPLARALEALVGLAAGSTQLPVGGTARELAEDYVARAWRVDAAVLAALGSVRKPEDVKAVGEALRGLYLEWLERANAAFQQEVFAHGLPRPASGNWTATPGLAVLFVDGLRFDVARLLEQQLDGAYDVSLGWQFAALPTVTSTAKPAVAPGTGTLTGHADLHASAAGRKVTAEVLRDQLRSVGFQPIARHDMGDAQGAAWTELGNFDRLGHDEGEFMPARLPDELRALQDRVEGLLAAGYREVRIVTDHGWLLLPGGLPKIELPAAITQLKKSRCALLKPGNHSDQPTVPWTWDPDVQVTVASGVACFEAGTSYGHGGVSLQESVVPVLTLKSRTPAATARISQVRWKGLVCRVDVEGAGAWQVDLRRKVGDPATSVVSGKGGEGNGKASLFVDDDSLEGQAGFVVLLQGGQVVGNQMTVIGGEG